ncbi:MAG: DNA repair protein RecN (Recombination protein N) [Chloroflexi bacterium]|jgi:DNA repair protein RecN (Recombination protein N)|nr:MAG: DNA repair protein RecN (Recombination protein N) [Chloroflexota bacterium]
MLKFLTITNFATIDHIELDLAKGLNVLTGETGSGKSIIVDAINLLMGGRANTASVRFGASHSIVEGIFHVNNTAIDAINTILIDPELCLDHEDRSLILSRRISIDGPSICRINGRIVTRRLLSEIAESLVDIHNQGEHLSLLRVKEHVNFLDHYAGISDNRNQLSLAIASLRSLQHQLSELYTDETERLRTIESLSNEVAEIDNARLQLDEDEALSKERRIVANQEQLITSLSNAYSALHDKEAESKSAGDMVGLAANSLHQIEFLDEHLKSFREIAEDISIKLADLAMSLRSYLDGLQYTPGRLQEIEERLDVILLLKRKYGPTVQQILEYREHAAARLEAISEQGEKVSELYEQQSQSEADIGRLASKLSAARSAATEKLVNSVEAELSQLAMDRTKIQVSISQSASDEGIPINGQRYSFDYTGIDQVEFLISPNSGEPLKPLATIASGGESSRIMLALKVTLSEIDKVPTLIFDEIDSGIGGRVGNTVGGKLSNLSQGRQVLCVTHLPQIASFADHHIQVTKVFKNGRTITMTKVLSTLQRIEEITEMLGHVSEASRQNAKDLLRSSADYKKLNKFQIEKP